MPTCFFCLFCLFGISYLQPAQAGHPYPDLLPHIAHEVREILMKNGMPVRHDGESPWSKFSGVPGDYTIYFYLADEIPQAAQLDTIRLCMDLYEQRERKERFRIEM